MAVHDGRIVFVKFILQGVVAFQDKNTGRFDDPFELLARIAFQHQDGTGFHTLQIAVDLFGEFRNLSPLFQSAVNSDMLFNFKCALFIPPVVHQVQT